MTQVYVLGFLFSPNRNNVVLIRKDHPEWMAGLLNGIGGKVESGELPDHAMHREFNEEAGVLGLNWGKPFARLHRENHWNVLCYAAFDSRCWAVRTMEREQVCIVSTMQALTHLGKQDGFLSNVASLVALALDDSGLKRPVLLEYEAGK